MLCPICNSEVPNNVKTCFTCGRIMEVPEKISSDKVSSDKVSADKIKLNMTKSDKMTFSLDDFLDDDPAMSIGRPEPWQSKSGNQQSTSKYSLHDDTSSKSVKQEQPKMQMSSSTQMSGSTAIPHSSIQTDVPNPSMRFSPSLQHMNQVQPAAPKKVPKQKKSALPKVLITVALILLVIGIGSKTRDSSSKKTETTKAAVSIEGGIEEMNAEVTTEEPKVEESLTESNDIVTVEEQVIYDDNDIKITVKGLDDSWFGTELKVLIENNSDKTVMVQPRDTSVNGYMVTALMSAEVAPGKKINDGITFETTGLKECGIEQIATMEFALAVIDSETWDYIVETDPIIVDTSVANSYVQEYDDSGNVLVDYGDFRIIEKGLSESSSVWGPGVILYIENNSDQNITVQVRDVSINGYMVESIISEDVLIGKKSITDLQFLSKDLEENGITDINDVEFYFHIFSWETFDTIYDSDVIKLSY